MQSKCAQVFTMITGIAFEQTKIQNPRSAACNKHNKQAITTCQQARIWKFQLSVPQIVENHRLLSAM